MIHSKVPIEIFGQGLHIAVWTVLSDLGTSVFVIMQMTLGVVLFLTITTLVD